MKQRHARHAIQAALDQDFAAFVDCYGEMTPDDRRILAEWVIKCERDGDAINGAPEWVRLSMGRLAALAMLEVGFRWGQRQEFD